MIEDCGYKFCEKCGKDYWRCCNKKQECTCKDISSHVSLENGGDNLK